MFLTFFLSSPIAKLKKRHTFAEATQRKPQKEQIQPHPGAYIEQASVKYPLSKASGPMTSVLQLSNYKRNSLWLNRKTKLLGASTTDNAPLLPERRDIMPKSPAPVLRIGSPMLLMPMDAQRQRTIHRRSIAQSPGQHPVVVDPSSASASSVPDVAKPRPTSSLKRISHRRSPPSASIATSFSMYSQSSGAQPLQRPVSKVVEETAFDGDKLEEDLDANRDLMTPSAESGWTAASYRSTAQCVWKDTQWDFVSPPAGVQEWVHFLESEEEDKVVSSESIEVTLPYLDSNATTPTSTGGVTYCADSPTPTLTSAGLQPPSKDDKCTRRCDKEEERASLLCLDYDYTAAIDQILYGDYFNDDASLLELARKPVPGPTPFHSQHSPEQQRPTFHPGYHARASHSFYKTISRRPSSSKRGHHLSTSTKKEFVVEKGIHVPAPSVLRHRLLSKSRRSSIHPGATRRSARPAMPGAFHLKAVPLPKFAPAPAVASLLSPTPLQRSQLEVSSPGPLRSRTTAVEGQVVAHQTAEAQTKAPGVHAKGRFGRLRGRGEDNPSSPMLKPKQKKSIFFNVVHFFSKG